MPAVCSRLAALISPMMSATLRTDCITSFIVRPAWSTRVEPFFVRSTAERISDSISLAASVVRCDSVRTSAATTAKPRPCSPARAASTAAFNARMLVWNAMPLITEVISPILRELSLMALMVWITSPTTAWPRLAWLAASSDRVFACSALCAFCFTVVVRCSTLEAVCCSALACDSVRVDRSELPCAISLEAPLRASVPTRTSLTMRARLSRMSRKPASRRAASSLPCTSMSEARSPRATRAVASTAACSGRVMLIVRRQAIRATARNTSAPMPAVAHCMARLSALAFSVACAVWLFCRLMKVASSCIDLFSSGSILPVMTAAACSVLKLPSRSTASLNCSSVWRSMSARRENKARSSLPRSVASRRALAAR